MLETISGPDRLLLLQFLCAFAWLDLEVSDKERAFVRRVAAALGLSLEESAQVDAWLRVAPPPHDLDPRRVPAEHRGDFLDSIRGLIYADGGVDPDEREAFEKLKASLTAS